MATPEQREPVHADMTATTGWWEAGAQHHPELGWLPVVQATFTNRDGDQAVVRLVLDEAAWRKARNGFSRAVDQALRDASARTRADRRAGHATVPAPVARAEAEAVADLEEALAEHYRVEGAEATMVVIDDPAARVSAEYWDQVRTEALKEWRAAHPGVRPFPEHAEQLEADLCTCGHSMSGHPLVVPGDPADGRQCNECACTTPTNAEDAT